MRVLHLLPACRHGAATYAARGLQAWLPSQGVTPYTAVWEPGGSPHAAAGLANLHRIDARGWSDPLAVLRLTTLVERLQVDCLHSWGNSIARVVGAGRTISRVLRGVRWLTTGERGRVSAPSASHSELLQVERCGSSSTRGADATPLARVFDRWLSRDATPADALAPPAPLLDGALPPDVVVDRNTIIAAGRFDRPHALLDAVWAYDILHYSRPELRLLVVGTGPERRRTEAFVGCGGPPRDSTFQFVDELPALVPALAQAGMVWVPHRHAGGEGLVRDALAVGTPVVAAAHPSRRVTEGVQFYPAGDRVALASVARNLADFRVSRHTLGDLGAWQRLYGIAAHSRSVAA